MTVLVFSDSHGITRNLLRAAKAHAGKADAVLHLGDGAPDLHLISGLFPGVPFYPVRGNCDPAYDCEGPLPRDRVVTLGSHRLYLCHGDLHSVSRGWDSLVRDARSQSADIALYGHLHIAEERYFPPASDGGAVHVFSPGSISLPRDGSPSYGLLLLSGGDVLFSVGRL
ncbi:MAG: YfcE family phosphodiesterase [Clostridia bacterium]|nr:YfcE family phosphodiesterase [Clostridia bacterium]MBQ4289685.1 YfcE family phosphodiesterase [Clostridia bacterium]